MREIWTLCTSLFSSGDHDVSVLTNEDQYTEKIPIVRSKQIVNEKSYFGYPCLLVLVHRLLSNLIIAYGWFQTAIFFVALKYKRNISTNFPFKFLDFQKS